MRGRSLNSDPRLLAESEAGGKSATHRSDLVLGGSGVAPGRGGAIKAHSGDGEHGQTSPRPKTHHMKGASNWI